MNHHNLHFQVEDISFTVRAGALIIANQHILVAKSDNQNCYYTVGGVLQSGESSSEAVLREVAEETGYALEILRLAFVQERFFIHNGKKHHEIVFFYLMKEQEITIENGTNTDQTTERLYWLPLDQLPAVNLVPAFLKDALQDIPPHPVHLISYE